jgi:hypothetical protein
MHECASLWANKSHSIALAGSTGTASRSGIAICEGKDQDRNLDCMVSKSYLRFPDAYTMHLSLGARRK